LLSTFVPARAPAINAVGRSVTLICRSMRALAVAFAVAIAGCASARPSATTQARDVRFTKGRDSVKGCTVLGVIDAGDKTNGGAVTQMPVERDPFRRLQNEAARLDGNTVLLNEVPVGMTGNNGPSGVLISGEAFRCARPVGWRL
jgi:Domain of unknown function (DUF4156)